MTTAPLARGSLGASIGRTQGFGLGLPVGSLLQVGRNATAGATIALKGTLRYQACDDSHCLFPVTLPVALAVTVVER